MTEDHETHPDCGHSIGWGYKGWVETHERNNGIKFNVGVSFTGPKIQLGKNLSNNDERVIHIEPVDDPDEATVIGCDEESCDNYHKEIRTDFKDSLRSDDHQNPDDKDRDEETVKTSYAH